MISAPGIGQVKAGLIATGATVGLADLAMVGLNGRAAESDGSSARSGVIGGLGFAVLSTVPLTLFGFVNGSVAAFAASPRMRFAAVAAASAGGLGAGAFAYHKWFASSKDHPHTAVNAMAAAGDAVLGGTLALWATGIVISNIEGHRYRAALALRAPELLTEVNAIRTKLDGPVPPGLAEYRFTTRMIVAELPGLIQRGRKATYPYLNATRSRMKVLDALAYHGLPQTVPTDLRALRDEIDTDIAATIAKGPAYGDHLDDAEVAAIQSKIDLLKLELAQR
jgi:hypothetical protein